MDQHQPGTEESKTETEPSSAEVTSWMPDLHLPGDLTLDYDLQFDLSDLSPQFIEETFKYFITSAERRLLQMTHLSSNGTNLNLNNNQEDVEALCRLVEEKERDLELAARIGQNLLNDNRTLRERNDELEEEVCKATDTVRRSSL